MKPHFATFAELAMRGSFVAALVAYAACNPSGRSPDAAAGPTDRASASATEASAIAAAPSATASAAAPPTVEPPRFAELVTTLSEPDANFFSDNYISNETSYLQVAAQLQRAARPGGAYIGVGPEQNFSYIALTRPSVAFIVDIRRENMVLHLLYKALFDEATSRSHFLTLLLGRPYEAASAPAADASVESVIAHAGRAAPDEGTFSAAHARMRERIEKQYGLTLDGKDRKTLEATHRAFFKAQLGLRFELKEKNGRLYPTLRELLAQADPEGKQLGFLATEDAFRFVQQMERQNRVIPLVGDFAGPRAMPGVASWLAAHKIDVSAFYVSNVEQYLFEPGVWAKWSRNVAAMPVDDRSVFIRCYLDQGKRHPKQMSGHRAATTLHGIAAFDARQEKKPFQSFWAVATEGILEDAPAPARTASQP